MSRKNWNSSESEHLTTMWVEGVPIKHIAAKLGRTKDSVKNRAIAMGIYHLRKHRAPIKQKAEKQQSKEYIDCMPNPFDCYRLRKLGFDINFYRTI